MNSPKEFLSGKPAYPGPQAAPPGMLKDQLLDSLKTKPWTDSSSLLEQLSQEIQSTCLQTGSTPELQSVLQNNANANLEKSMIAWVDKFFDYFQDFIAELAGELKNHNLEIFCERPVICRTSLVFNHHTPANDCSIVFRGCLNTGSWTLLLRGTIESIDAYILPSDRLLSLTCNQELFRRLLFLKSSWQNQEVVWQHADVVTTFESIGGMAKQLFAYLIQFAAGKRQESELWLTEKDNEQVEPEPETSVSRPAPATLNVTAAAQQLNDSIAQEITAAREAGMSAISRSNFIEAQRLTTLINRLQTLQAGLVELMAPWLASIKSE